MSNKPIKATFLDSDLAQLFSNIEETRLTSVTSALFLQTIDYLIRKQPGRKKSILVTVPGLHKEWFPYLSYSATKRIVQRLRRIGVLKTRIEYKKVKGKIPEHATRIWIQEKRILELAQQVRSEVELKEMVKRINGKT